MFMEILIVVARVERGLAAAVMNAQNAMTVKHQVSGVKTCVRQTSIGSARLNLHFGI